MVEYAETFKYDIGEIVAIKALNCTGLVVGHYFGRTGTQYEVAYFVAGEHQTTYLYEQELDVAPATQIGFIK